MVARRELVASPAFCVVSTVSAQVAPGLTPSAGRRGRKSRKLPSSWATDWASALSDGTAFTNSPRRATRPANTSLRTLTMLSATGAGVPESATIESRSEEHTSELQSPYVISYAVFSLKKKQHQDNVH